MVTRRREIALWAQNGHSRLNISSRQTTRVPKKPPCQNRDGGPERAHRRHARRERRLVRVTARELLDLGGNLGALTSGRVAHEQVNDRGGGPCGLPLEPVRTQDARVDGWRGAAAVSRVVG